MTSQTLAPLPRSAGTLSRRVWAAVAAALLVVAAGVCAAASPAFAHDDLAASDPAADAVLAEAPAEVTLSFTAQLTTGAGATEVQVTEGMFTFVAIDEQARPRPIDAAV